MTILAGTTTVGEVIRRARNHHGAFRRDAVSDRAALSFLSTRHRELLKELAEDLRDRLSEARNVAATIANSLVGVDENGVLFTVASDEDGFDVIEDANGVLHTGPIAIATDPIADGFPLPTTSLKILAVYARMTSSQRDEKVTLVPAGRQALDSGVGKLMATVVGWRLQPLINPPTDAVQAGAGIAVGALTLWQSVESVTVVWIDEPPVFTDVGEWESQQLLLPNTYCDALEFELAAFMARRVPDLDATMYERDAAFHLDLARKGAPLDHARLKVRHTRRRR